MTSEHAGRANRIDTARPAGSNGPVEHASSISLDTCCGPGSAVAATGVAIAGRPEIRSPPEADDQPMSPRNGRACVNGSSKWLNAQAFCLIPEQVLLSNAPGQPPLSRWMPQIDRKFIP